MHTAEPQQEHKWLAELVGEWDYEGEAMMGPDQPPLKCTGRARTRMLGGLWLITDNDGAMPDGGMANMIITLGFDPAKGRFVGTFIGSMMTNLWVYDGELNAAANTLTLNADGPSFVGDGTTAHYQDIIEIKNKDHHVLSSQVEGPDGSWTKFMTAHYRRKK